jgi:hypothetical protein
MRGSFLVALIATQMTEREKTARRKNLILAIAADHAMRLRISQHFSSRIAFAIPVMKTIQTRRRIKTVLRDTIFGSFR